jgi:hypothetical protein
MFYVSVLCFKEQQQQLTTSSLPPTARPSSFTRVRPCSSSPPPQEAAAGHLEAARDPSFLLLSTRASSPPFPYSHPLPPWELELQFTLHTPPFSNFICHQVCHNPASRLNPPEQPLPCWFSHANTSSPSEITVPL